MPKKSTGARLAQIGLNPELLDRVNDFRNAYLDATEVRIISEALELFMKQELGGNDGIRERYNLLRQKKDPRETT